MAAYRPQKRPALRVGARVLASGTKAPGTIPSSLSLTLLELWRAAGKQSDGQHAEQKLEADEIDGSQQVVETREDHFGKPLVINPALARFTIGINEAVRGTHPVLNMVASETNLTFRAKFHDPGLYCPNRSDYIIRRFNLSQADLIYAYFAPFSLGEITPCAPGPHSH
jgi:hypothetical protein